MDISAEINGDSMQTARSASTDRAVIQYSDSNSFLTAKMQETSEKHRISKNIGRRTMRDKNIHEALYQFIILRMIPNGIETEPDFGTDG